MMRRVNRIMKNVASLLIRHRSYHQRHHKEENTRYSKKDLDLFINPEKAKKRSMI